MAKTFRLTIMRNNVDLPEPLGPVMWINPGTRDCSGNKGLDTRGVTTGRLVSCFRVSRERDLWARSTCLSRRLVDGVMRERECERECERDRPRRGFIWSRQLNKKRIQQYHYWITSKWKRGQGKYFHSHTNLIALVLIAGRRLVAELSYDSVTSWLPNQ